jgi:histidine ammonia-lyase
VQELVLNGKDLHPQHVAAIARGEIKRIQIDQGALIRVGRVHEAFNKIARSSEIYGTTTASGARKGEAAPTRPNATIPISATISNAFGTLEPGASKAMLAIQINSMLAGGIGAVSPELVMKLRDVFNTNNLASFPRIPPIGLGDGDLNSLAAFAKWWMDKDKGFELKPGEDLALFVGNYYSDAQSAIAVSDLDRLMNMTYLTFAVTSEAFGTQTEAIHPDIATARPIPRLSDAIAHARQYLSGGALLEGRRKSRNLQDPISFRSFPQVCAAVEHQLEELATYLGIEINSSAQNPLFSEVSNQIIHNANFDTTQHSITMSALQLAIAKCADISFKRLRKLCDPRFNEATSGFGQQGAPLSGVHAFNLPTLAGQAISYVNQYARTNIIDSAALSFEDDIEDSVSGVFQQSLNLSKMIVNLKVVIGCELIAGIAGIKHRIKEGELQEQDLAPAVAKIYQALSPQVDVSGTAKAALNNIDHLLDSLNTTLVPARTKSESALQVPGLGGRSP